MRKLLTALGTAIILMACHAIIWNAEAAMVTGVENLPLANSYSLVERARCVCGPYGCTCGRRHWRPYGSPGYPGYRPYRSYGYGYRPTVMGIAGAIKQQQGTRTLDPIVGCIVWRCTGVPKRRLAGIFAAALLVPRLSSLVGVSRL